MAMFVEENTALLAERDLHQSDTSSLYELVARSRLMASSTLGGKLPLQGCMWFAAKRGVRLARWLDVYHGTACFYEARECQRNIFP